MNRMEEQGLLEPIAVIGMACRVPGARNVDEFWRNLRDGLESIAFFSDDELAAAGVPPSLIEHPSYVKAYGVLADIDEFDAPFFGYTPKEARAMDPQHRVFLETAWEALENAGHAPDATRDRVGVFAGAGQNTYLLNALVKNRAFLESLHPMQALICTDKDFLTTHVSYRLNLTGPSINVNAACSTSLVAVYLACRDLLSYGCDMALAGGVQIDVPQVTGYLYQEGGILSPDGHCRAFDAGAGGTVPGSGVGIVVLKRLSDALGDGDTIHAVIKGSAINNDGAVKAGYTTPSVEGEAQVIVEAQALAGFDPETIRYIEAHGTGTAIGDPIEIAALTDVFRHGSDAAGYCAVGSVKTNVGHLGAAAGVAGLIKAVLSLEHALIPPTLHFEKPNPRIDLDNSPFYVSAALREWPAGPTPRRAGVSSFGIGGTNAHVVLEEAPRREESGSSRPWQLLTISAKSLAALETATGELAAHLAEQADVSIADAAYTLHVGRSQTAVRRTAVCGSTEDATSVLETIDPYRVSTTVYEPGRRHVVFLFPGQGAQHLDMGGELYRTEPLFTEQIDTCAAILEKSLNADLRELLYSPHAVGERAAARLGTTGIAQPAIFATEYALARLWIQWGVIPSSMIGHSVGEYTAACLAGVLPLEDALLLVAERGRLMQEMPPGEMMAVPLPANDVQPLLGGTLALAAVNGPSLCTVSGDTADIDSLHRRLEETGLQCRRLHTSHAFHSAMMDPILAPFTERAARVPLSPPTIPYVSNLTGDWIKENEATDPSYWAEHLRRTVRFSEGLSRIIEEPNSILLEVGPGRTMSALAMQHRGESAEFTALSSLPHPKDRTSDCEFIMTTLGKLWMTGVPVDWHGFHAHERRRRIPLPTYPFERNRYWVEAEETVLAGHSLAEGPVAETGIPKESDAGRWFFMPSWILSSPPGAYRNDASIPRPCLVFDDGGGLGARISHLLRGRGIGAATVTTGDRFARRENRSYTIDPDSEEDYGALLDDLALADSIPRTIIHLWSVAADNTGPSDAAARSGSPAPPGFVAPSGIVARPGEVSPSKAVAPTDTTLEADYERFLKTQRTGLYSLVSLARAIGERYAGDISLTVVTDDIHDVTGGERLRPDAATLLAAVRIIPQEYPHIRCRCIDIDSVDTDNSHGDQTADTILGEVASATYDTVIAYRGGRRWVQTYVPVRLDGVTPLLRREGVYLITGGFGRIGGALARYLAAEWKAKLLLTGRTEIPERGSWENRPAAHEDKDGTGRRIRDILELEALGAEVIGAGADAADFDEMERCIRAADERFGRLDGVFHAAGLVGRDALPLIRDTGRASFELHFETKVRGTLVLDRLLRGRTLDFCVLQSSLSTVLGGLGFTAYAAANLFMDSFAGARARERRTPWIAVDWDGWLFPEEETPARETAPSRSLARSSPPRLALSPEEGIAAFRRILTAHRLPHVIVSTADLKRRIKRWVDLESLRIGGVERESDRRAGEHEVRRRRDQDAPRTDREREIARSWREVLGFESVGLHDDFFEIGGTSLHAIQLIQRLQETLCVPIPVDIVFEAPTIAELASRIDALPAETREDAPEEAGNRHGRNPGGGSDHEG